MNQFNIKNVIIKKPGNVNIYKKNFNQMRKKL